MRPKALLLITGAVLLLVSTVWSGDNSWKTSAKTSSRMTENPCTQKLSWISAYFSVDHINRNNDYNSFATFETTNFTDATIPWLGEAKIIGLDFGMVFNRRFAWSVGGEYWFKLGESLEGTYFYEPSATYVENPSSEITVYGASTSLQYYFLNPPSLTGQFEKLALRAGVGIGFYKAKWEVWDEYQSLNLATSTTVSTGTNFEDQTVGFSCLVGLDYPTRLWNLILGFDVSYQYINFDNVAWYNVNDDEIIATYTGDSDGRVNLGLSGFRAKLEIKHFICW